MFPKSFDVIFHQDTLMELVLRLFGGNRYGRNKCFRKESLFQLFVGQFNRLLNLFSASLVKRYCISGSKTGPCLISNGFCSCVNKMRFGVWLSFLF